MENLLTQYNPGLAGNQTRDQSKFVFFRYVISGSAVKLPPHKKGLPGDEISFILFPLYPPARRAYGEFAGQVRPWTPLFSMNYRKKSLRLWDPLRPTTVKKGCIRITYLDAG
jgi:hypothetical protein